MTNDMALALEAYDRRLFLLAWFETAGDPLYCWSGMHPLSYDGQTWLGVGGLYGVGPVDKGDALSFRTIAFTLNGLDGEALAGMDESVQGRQARLWLAALNDAGQVIADPELMGEFEQDTLQREMNGDGTVTLKLNCFEALTRFDRATGRKWSPDSQKAKFSGDEGFYYTTQIAKQGRAIDWRPDTA